MRSGDVVLLDFPYSDLSGSKVRPAIVVADAGGTDFIACQVTSNRDADTLAIELNAASFAVGGLRIVSFARPGKLFTANRRIVVRRVATLVDAVRDQVKDATVNLIVRG
jgi:PemK-like, MazF-like toxin of type II toxin-antitoxin system